MKKKKKNTMLSEQFQNPIHCIIKLEERGISIPPNTQIHDLHFPGLVQALQ